VTAVVRLDVRDVACPLTWVRTRVALARLAEGERLEVLIADGEPAASVPRTAKEEGHRVALCEPLSPPPGWRVVLEKGAPPPRNDVLP
jgi:TusA-related sulfurtransferase